MGSAGGGLSAAKSGQGKGKTKDNGKFAKITCDMCDKKGRLEKVCRSTLKCDNCGKFCHKTTERRKSEDKVEIITTSSCSSPSIQGLRLTVVR